MITSMCDYITITLYKISNLDMNSDKFPTFLRS